MVDKLIETTRSAWRVGMPAARAGDVRVAAQHLARRALSRCKCDAIIPHPACPLSATGVETSKAILMARSVRSLSAKEQPESQPERLGAHLIEALFHTPKTPLWTRDLLDAGHHFFVRLKAEIEAGLLTRDAAKPLLIAAYRSLNGDDPS